jgi:hydroxypyruvate isomerase
VGAARAAGFEAVEVLFPYDDPAPRLLDRLDAAGLPLALINCPPPNYAGGPRGFAAVPGLQDRFRNDFRRAARLAATLGAQHLHVLAGGAKDGAEGEDARRAFVENLRWAAAAAPRQRLTIEPLNGQDNPGTFLQSFELACEVLDEVGAPTLGLQFDTHHAALIAGDVHAAWARVAPRVTHVQVAGAGRREPDDPDFLHRLDRDGYGGWVSGEYHPKGRTEDGLGWMRPHAPRAA